MLMKILMFPVQVVAFLVVVLAWAVIVPVTYVVLWCGSLGRKVWEFVTEQWAFVSDPGYYRLGVSGLRCRDMDMCHAARALAQGDRQAAIDHWFDAARLFSARAMGRLGECYEQGDGVEQDLAVAHEWYAMAVRYHGGPEYEEKCARLRPHAMSRKERDAFYEELKKRWKR